ncbi:MAG TPA: hypothetical protein DCG75_11565 [Bacteroidales bacterium]|jgi:nitrogen fixation/metabolism regulation signal transduction histidine kinase|nr:hypothetical protein [Bacteroidales bacterium]
MIFKNLYINIIIRVLLIVATPILFVFANEKYNDIVININIAALLIIQVILLIRRLNYLNRDLIAFFDSLKYDDSSILLTNEFQNINYLQLSRRLQMVNKQIITLKEKSIKQDHYFKVITEIANVGLLSFNETGTVKLANKALKELLRIRDIVNISELNGLHPDFSSTIQNLQASEQKLLKVTILENNSIKILNLLVKLAEFKTNEEKLKIVSIQDIKNELDEKELESWQKLIRILRHEIMNSIGPISSTIDTLNEIITNPENNKTLEIKDLNNEIISDIGSGLKIIKERNIGLQQFVDSFKSISRLPEPKFEKIKIESLFTHIALFWKKEFAIKNIQFQAHVDPDIEFIFAGKNQIEQLIINLIKNSIEANSSQISISAFEEISGNISIQITDNGKGIKPEMIDEIFMPFFTTKEQGSGIGLSLARQIMRLHSGNISVQSVPGMETTFLLMF